MKKFERSSAIVFDKASCERTSLNESLDHQRTANCAIQERVNATG